MPLYDFNCPACGRLANLVRGYEDYTIACPQCGGTAERVPVYRDQYTSIKDGPNSILPPRPKTDAEHAEVNALLSKEMAKRNYPTDRVYDDLRSARTQTVSEDGQTDYMAVDTSRLPQEI